MIRRRESPAEPPTASIGYRRISTSDRETWQHVLRRVPHAFGHTWEYCRAVEMTSGWPTFLLEIVTPEGVVVCPFHEREFGGHRDLTTPCGFSGFAGAIESPAFLERWARFVQDEGYLCVYAALHPALGSPAAFPSEDVFAGRSLFLIDLTRSAHELHANLGRNRRREVRVSRDHTWDRATLVCFFLDHYHAFMRNRGASAASVFSREALSVLLGSPQLDVIGAGVEQVEAVLVFGHTRWSGDFLFSISTDGGESHSASLLWRAAMQLKEQAIPVFHLGGGIRSNDGVAEFKRRFGSIERPMHAIKQVFDGDTYRRLCGMLPSAGLDRSGYFPAYWRA